MLHSEIAENPYHTARLHEPWLTYWSAVTVGKLLPLESKSNTVIPTRGLTCFSSLLFTVCTQL